MMRFAYSPDQPHQLAALRAAADLFEYHPRAAPAMVVAESASLVGVCAVPNVLAFTDSEILANARKIQQRAGNLLPPGMEGKIPDESGLISAKFPDAPEFGLLAGKASRFLNFSVEMETGTGKTYVYLRTMHELAHKYGLLKFIVIVPSIAVREGVLHSMRTMREHFREIYGLALESAQYNSGRLGGVRNFAESASPQALVMTIQSVAGKGVVAKQALDALGGEAPLSLIQAARPVLILDEPQNMETATARKALALMNPIFALRYSATHRVAYNLIHRLGPAESYDRGLVKRIEVMGVAGGDTGAAYARLVRVSLRGRMRSARIEANFGNIRKEVTLKLRESLEEKTKLPDYKGFTLADIVEGSPPKVIFQNGVTLARGEATGDRDKEEIFRAQIKHALLSHFVRQRRLREFGVKILSLFFIDKVDNYRREDGLIRRLFEETFDEMKAGEWKDIPAAAVHAGYFAKSVGGDTERDAKAYQLIMRDKESLLTFANPEADDAKTLAKRRVAFIFTHSALREGWDNPNIFQICTLNETVGEMRKRQEIGRGLRLAVNQRGERVGNMNLLTIIPNRNYAQYAAEYQQEVREDCRALVRDRFGGEFEDLPEQGQRFVERHFSEAAMHPVIRAGEGMARANPRHIKIREADGKIAGFSPEFKNLWTRIAQKTRCRFRLDGGQFAAKALSFMPREIPGMEVVVQGGMLFVDKKTGAFVTHATTGTERIKVSTDGSRPDIAAAADAMLRGSGAKLRLSRETLCRMIQGDKKRAMGNPYGWARSATVAIRAALADSMEKGVVYEKVDGKFFKLRDAAESEMSAVGEHVAELGDSEKSVYEKIQCDSDTERQFAEGVIHLEDVKLFIKLPSKFKIPTPIGGHTPDWAILLSGEEGGEELILVGETKSGEAVGKDGHPNLNKLRPEEKAKVECAAHNFGSKQLKTQGPLDGTDYQVVKEAKHVRRAPRKKG